MVIGGDWGVEGWGLGVGEEEVEGQKEKKRMN